MSAWRDMTRIPKGMSDFQRWYRPPGIDSKKVLSDMDGILHTLNGNRFLMFEFKPEGSQLTVGQRITMEGFSKLPGCTALCVFDPYWDDDSRARYDDDVALRVQVFKDGKHVFWDTDLEGLNESIAEWFNR